MKSLYTVIPNDCGLQALTNFLDKRDIKEPSTSTLTRLAELVLTLNSFSFKNEYYRQVGGVAMGVEWVQTMPAYSTDMWNNKSVSSTLDSYHSFTRGTSTTLLEQLLAGGMNSKTLLTLFLYFHPALQFTLHELLPKRNYGKPFLDINLLISEDRIKISVFYKETDTHDYLHFSSFHPDHCKRAIPYSQFLPLRRLCSDNDDFLIKSREMMTFFTHRGYPLTALEQDLRRVTTIGRPDALTGRNGEIQPLTEYLWS